MSGKPTRAPAGFLNAKQVAKKAREMGFLVNAKTLVKEANAGKVPFGELLPGRKKGLFFPESKLIKVIAASPKEAITPEGMFTTKDLYRIAKKRGISVNQWHVVEKINAIVAGREPAPGVFSQDPWHFRHKYFLSWGFIRAFLKDGIRRKNLPQYLQRGLLVSLEDLGTRLGISRQALCKWRKKGKIKAYLVSKRSYVTLWEAERFSEWYNRNVNGTRSSKGGKTRAKRSSPRAVPKAEKKPVNLADAAMSRWLEKNSKHLSPARHELIERLIRQSKGVSMEEYREKVLPLLERILSGY